MNKITRSKEKRHAVRKFRVRAELKGTSDRPRLVLHRSLRYLSAQIIDDVNHSTLVGCSTVTKSIASAVKSKKNLDAAVLLGEAIAEKSLEKGIKKVVFDRNGYLYHGRIKAFADAVRAKGIEF